MPPLNYAGKLVLAPMVRTGELPTRLAALKYGADLVWSPEIVDKKILTCKRVVNEKIDCVDFVQVDKETSVAFRTHRTLEKGKVVFQLGTANPELAVAAALMVAPDVAGIDVNSGCPKHFSVHSGMGAALLKTPDKLVSILEALVRDVGKKHDIGISVKIRLLESQEDTVALVRRLCTTGIAALTVHCRYVHTRPRERAIRDGYLTKIAEVCHESGVTCIANGDVSCRGDLATLQENYGVDSAMIAVSAESNVSCFSAYTKQDLVSWRQVAREILDNAIAVDNNISGTKFLLGRIISGKDRLYQQVAQSKSHLDILLAFNNETEEPGSKVATPQFEKKNLKRRISAVEGCEDVSLFEPVATLQSSEMTV
ncbi:hypothetical protein V1512DRAFT_264719 [Lipomyces arxii]|uniref:uncharacterized protein n=1 Tax=Lipomyces arxii TaxID=56418 RepID=UPI0034CEC420